MENGASSGSGEDREGGPSESLDAIDLNAFLESFMAEERAKWKIPGVACAVVRDGEAILSKGYGAASRETRTAVDPSRTIFRAGSVSKLVTATVAMQLFEKGLWDVRDDVNGHLRAFRIRNPYPRPISVADLLTHSSGLGDTFLGQHVKRPGDVVPLGAYLARRLPPVSRPPGRFFRYSDHGASLLGHLVEEVSGVRFDQYAERNIFRPLRMERTTFRQPPPADWIPDLAVGYGLRRGSQVPYALDGVHTTPAAGLYTTASDMTRFMAAHLEGGALGDVRILNEATVAEMHRRQFAHHPQLRGRAYGFSEWLENGQRALFHDGSMPGFNSRLFLLPAHHVGFFLSWNNNSGGLKHAFTSEFLDRYFPEDEGPKEERQPRLLAPGRARRFAGGYRDNLYSRRTLEKVVALNERVRVREDAQETLRVGSTRLAEVEDDLFENLEGEGRIAFREEGTRVTHLYMGTGAFDRIPWWESGAFSLGFLGFSTLVFLWGLVAPLLDATGVLSRGLPLSLLTLLALISGLNLLFFLSLTIGLPRVDLWAFAYGIPPSVKGMLLLPLAAIALTLVSLVLGIGFWADPTWTSLGRLHYALLLGTALALAPWLNAWKLLGFRTG